jgi:alkyl hydroperoxide reductase subunit AhpC
VGRNIDEILRVLDALELAVEHIVSTPVDRKQRDEVVISPSVSDENDKSKFPKGFRRLKPYLRLTPQPGT